MILTFGLTTVLVALVVVFLGGFFVGSVMKEMYLENNYKIISMDEYREL